MLKRLHIRFSLLSLLLVVTLAAVVVSHWLANRSLRQRDDVIAQQKGTIRTLSDELGRLSVDDPAMVQVISLTADLERPNPPWKVPLKWHIHLPQSKDWQVCWAAGSIATNGVPASKLGSYPVTPSADGSVELTLSYGPRLSDGMSLVFHGNDEVWFGDIPREALAPFADNDWVDNEIAGSQAGQAQTESSLPTGAVRLLRQWNLQNLKAIGNCPGIAVWLEPVPRELVQHKRPDRSVTKKAIAGDATSPAPGSG